MIATLLCGRTVGLPELKHQSRMPLFRRSPPTRGRLRRHGSTWTRYVTVADADVAYQVVGDGDTDLLYCYGLGSHLEMFWEVPETADYLHRLAALAV